jgi:hypothetical protein
VSVSGSTFPAFFTTSRLSSEHSEHEQSLLLLFNFIANMYLTVDFYRCFLPFSDSGWDLDSELALKYFLECVYKFDAFHCKLSEFLFLANPSVIAKNIKIIFINTNIYCRNSPVGHSGHNTLTMSLFLMTQDLVCTYVLPPFILFKESASK